MIVLDENFSIEREPHCWVLQFQEKRSRVNKEGIEEYYFSKDITYHATLKQALKSFLDRVTYKAKSIEEVLNKISYTEEIINNLKLK